MKGLALGAAGGGAAVPVVITILGYPFEAGPLIVTICAALITRLLVTLDHKHKRRWLGSALDFEWGAGERQAAIMLQRMVGAVPDGNLGPASAAAYAAFVARHGLEAVASGWADARDAFYRLLVAQKPANGIFLAGWVRRTAYYRPGSPWWKRQVAPARKAA